MNAPLCGIVIVIVVLAFGAWLVIANGGSSNKWTGM